MVKRSAVLHLFSNHNMLRIFWIRVSLHCSYSSVWAEPSWEGFSGDCSIGIGWRHALVGEINRCYIKYTSVNIYSSCIACTGQCATHRLPRLFRKHGSAQRRTGRKQRSGRASAAERLRHDSHQQKQSVSAFVIAASLLAWFSTRLRFAVLDKRAVDVARDEQTKQLLSVKPMRDVTREAQRFEGPLLKVRTTRRKYSCNSGFQWRNERINYCGVYL